MAIYPGASVRLIDTAFLSGKAMAVYNRVNLHTQAGLGSLYGFFNQSGRASSHFWVGQAGQVEQYVDTHLRAEADLDGNDATVSIETEGGQSNADAESWTSAQLAAIVPLVDWILSTHGIARQLASNSFSGNNSSKGLSWHRLGIDGNFPALPSILAGRGQRGGGMYYSSSFGKVCPGNTKINQIPGIFNALGGAAPIEPPPTQPPAHEILDVDGQWGAATTRRLQQRAGTPVDGVVSHQWKSSANENLFAAQFDTSQTGSTIIRAIQELIGMSGAAVDGLCGSGTITQMQQYLGTPVDGVISNPSAMVSEMQRRLNASAA